MAVEDEEKTAFITPIGCFFYTCMPFGLKNAGATFQRAMGKCLGSPIGCNVEAYIDDIVVKSRSKETLIDDLHETFANLRQVRLKLNAAKCTFGEPSGKLLRYLVSHRGIEANPVDGFHVARTWGTTRRTQRFEHRGLNVGDLGS
jgi:hypothetical protein